MFHCSWSCLNECSGTPGAAWAPLAAPAQLSLAAKVLATRKGLAPSAHSLCGPTPPRRRETTSQQVVCNPRREQRRHGHSPPHPILALGFAQIWAWATAACSLPSHTLPCAAMSTLRTEKPRQSSPGEHRVTTARPIQSRHVSAGATKITDSTDGQSHSSEPEAQVADSPWMLAGAWKICLHSDSREPSDEVSLQPL